MPRALLLPSYLGGGFGHIGRCQALAAALEQRGWQTAFTLGGQHAERVRRAGYSVYDVRRPGRPLAPQAAAPAFTVIADLNYQLVRDGLVRPAILRSCVAEQLGIIRRFRPDVLIADTWPLAGVLAALAGLPLVQVMRAIVHPAAPNLLWWQERPAGLVSPDPRPVFNPVLESWGLPAIRRGEDLLAGDLVLVPSIPELDPLPSGLEDTHYVGPLIRAREEALPAWLEALDLSRPLVYVTGGGGAGLSGGLQFYQALVEALGGCDLQGIVSTGAKVSPADLPALPPNVHVESWVPGPAVIARSSLVVYSGGYGTTMEAVLAGVPGLVIPSHSEQESNARRLEACEAARVLLPSQADPVAVWHRWPGGRFSTLVSQHSDLTPEIFRQAVLSALADPVLKAGARRLQALAVGYRGAARAVELIETWLSTSSRPVTSGWNRLNWWQKLILQRG